MRDSSRYEVTSVIGMVQMLACVLIPRGYWFYKYGVIPEGKPVGAVDAKLMARYEVKQTTSARVWRKAKGLANVRYLRYQREFILIATMGKHKFHIDEKPKDLRHDPLHFHGYSISYKKGSYLQKEEGEELVPDDKYHARVQIGKREYAKLRRYFLELAKHASTEELSSAYWHIPFEPYATVRRQVLRLRKLVNKKRHGTVPMEAIRMKRDIVKPFEPQVHGQRLAA